MARQIGGCRGMAMTGQIVRTGTGDHLVGAQGPADQGAVAGLADAQSQIEPVADQIAGAIIIVDPQFQLRVLKREARKDRAQEKRSETHGRGDGQPPAQGCGAIHPPGCAVGGRCQGGERRAQLFRQPLRRFGRSDAACIAQKQRGLQRTLQIGDAFADHGFRQVHMRGGSGDCAKFHHRQEGFDFV